MWTSFTSFNPLASTWIPHRRLPWVPLPDIPSIVDSCLPSGKIVQFAIENDKLNIIEIERLESSPSKNGGSFHGYSKPLPELLPLPRAMSTRDPGAPRAP